MHYSKLTIPIISVNGKIEIVGEFILRFTKTPAENILTLIKDEINDYLEITDSWYYVRYRHGELVYPRQLYMFFAQRYTKMSLAAIGMSLPIKKDHATVLHAKRVIITGAESNPAKHQELLNIDYRLSRKGLKVQKNLVESIKPLMRPGQTVEIE